MRRCLLIGIIGSLLALARCGAQLAFAMEQGSTVYIGNQDASGANSTSPCKTQTTAPSGCLLGHCWIDSDATPGLNFFVCTDSATHTWTLQGDGTGSGGITGATADSGGTASGPTVTWAGGIGIDTTRSSNTITIAIDGTDIPFAPSTPANWNGGVDPGDADDAFNQLASLINPMLPASALALSHESYVSTAGASGKNTWNAANTISGYANAPADSSINAADALDVTVGTSGTGKGVYDWDTIVSVTGVLADLSSASGACPTYPAQAFSPGGSDGGATNNLLLVVNGTTKHTTNLLSFSSGSSLNGNGSGFTALSVATAVKFPDCVSTFSPRTYRNGPASWVLVKADMSKGWNVVKTQQVTASGTVTTNVWEFLLDDDNTATTITSESLTSLTKPNTKTLSGVTYSITPVTATYAATVNNQYRNTYVSGNAITDASTNCSLANFPKTLANSAGVEAKTTAISETATLTGTRLLNGSITGKVTTARTVQGSVTSTGAAIAGILYDNQAATSTNLSCGFDDENDRLKAGDNFATNLAPDWVGSNSLVGGSADYNTGALFYNSTLVYPTAGANGGNFGAITNAPAGNPNYSGATGARDTYLLFTTASPTASNFRLTANGTATLIADATSFTNSTDQIKISVRLPSQTGWLDVMGAFVEGQFADGNGAYSASLGNDQTIPTSNLGFTFGSKSSASSFDDLLIRIKVPQGWTGNLTDISVVWSAS